MKCPKCLSDDVLRLSVIHSAGLADIDANSAGRTTIIGEAGFSLGFTNFKTVGTVQTRLSKLANPPHKMPYRTVLFAWFLGLLIAGWLLGYTSTITHAPESLFEQHFRWFAYGYSFLATFVIVVLWKYNHKIFPLKHDIWSCTFICQCCGEIFQVSTKKDKS